MTFDSNDIFEIIENSSIIDENSIIYIGKLKKNFIKQYILQYDNDFYEPLSQRVDLEKFANKINKLSTTFVIVYRGQLAGLIASYFYDRSSKKGFITLVHTKAEFRGKHLAIKLVEAVKIYAKSLDFSYIDLAVYKDNIAAFKLYLNNGFIILSEEEGRCVMRNDLLNK